MKPFDKNCRKYGITYSAVVDKSDPHNPTYYVFFREKKSRLLIFKLDQNKGILEAGKATVLEQSHERREVMER